MRSFSRKGWIVAASITVALTVALSVAGVLLYRSAMAPRPIADGLPPVAEEDVPLLKPSSQPDAYGDFEEVLAALPLETRRLVLLTKQRDPEAAMLKAKSWVMTKHNMKGRPREVEPFLVVLERPLERLPSGSVALEPLRQPDERSRMAAMYALAKAVISGLDYGESLLERIEAAAVANFDVHDCRHNATVVLLLLGERGVLGDAGAAILAKALNELPVYFYEQLRDRKASFEAGETG